MKNKNEICIRRIILLVGSIIFSLIGCAVEKIFSFERVYYSFVIFAIFYTVWIATEEFYDKNKSFKLNNAINKLPYTIIIWKAFGPV